MKDKWNDLNEWEDKHKIAVFVTISVDDVREWFDNECVDPDKSPIKDLTDDDLWEAILHVSRKYDFGGAYEDVYDWVVEKAQEWKESENA